MNRLALLRAAITIGCALAVNVFLLLGAHVQGWELSVWTFVASLWSLTGIRSRGKPDR